MTLGADLSPAEKQALVEARDAALAALHSYAAWLEERIPWMGAFVPMGRANYDLYVRRVHLLPFDAEQIEMLGQAELNRYRGLEALLSDPSLASPDPARSTYSSQLAPGTPRVACRAAFSSAGVRTA